MSKKKGLHFADEKHKIADMLLCGKTNFIQSYGYLTDEDWKKTFQYILNKLDFCEQAQDEFNEIWGEEIYSWGKEYHGLITKGERR